MPADVAARLRGEVGGTRGVQPRPGVRPRHRGRVRKGGADHPLVGVLLQPPARRRAPEMRRQIAIEERRPHGEQGSIDHSRRERPRGAAGFPGPRRRVRRQAPLARCPRTSRKARRAAPVQSADRRQAQRRVAARAPGPAGSAETPIRPACPWSATTAHGAADAHPSRRRLRGRREWHRRARRARRGNASR